MRIFQWIAAGVIGVVLGIFVGLAMVDKGSLYGWAKTKLEPYGVELFESSLEAKTWGVMLEDVRVRYTGSTVLRAQNLDFTLWGASAKRMRSEGIVAQAMPPRIQEASLNPLSFSNFLSVSGDFGKGVGVMDFSKFTFRLSPSEEMKKSYSQSLKAFKIDGGEYVYNVTF